MTLDGFITFLGLMIAAYAALSPITRLKIRVQSTRQIVVGVIVIVSIAMLQFHDSIDTALPKEIQSFIALLSLTPDQLSFILVIAWITASCLLYSIGKPRAGSLPSLMRLVNSLHDEGRYLEIIDLTDPYLPLVEKALNRELPFQRQREWLLEENKRAANPIRELMVHRTRTLPRWLARCVPPFATLLPSRCKATRAAEAFVDLVTQSNEMILHLAKFRPLAGIRLMGLRGVYDDYFSFEFIKYLALSEGSPLRKELRSDGSMLSDRQQVLRSLVGDSKRAAQLSIWKPVGDATVHLISEDKTYQATLNKPCSSDERKVFNDPVFCSIMFFDAMVKRAAQSGYEDHMWLMYMSVYVEAIEECYAPDEDCDPATEFPTLGTRLIWEAFCCLRGWLKLAVDLPRDNPHVSERALAGEGAGIPYWAAGDLCTAMRCVALSRRLPQRFRVDRFETFVRSVSQLPVEGSLAPLRQFLIRGVISGPYFGAENISDTLADLARKIDPFVLSSADDLRSAIGLP